MTTPGFTQLIALNTPSRDERTTPMTATTLAINHHIGDLQQVATDLRNERELAAPKRARANRFRLALGTALVNLGSAVAGHRAAAAGPRAKLQAR